MFDRILLPVGLDAEHETTLEAVVDLRGAREPVVTLLHVIQTVENLSFDELEGFYGKLEDKAAAYLKNVEKKFARKGVSTRSAIVYGNRVEQILEYAEKDASDLILMSSHKVKAEQPAKGWNSISHTIAIFAPCPVLLLK